MERVSGSAVSVSRWPWARRDKPEGANCGVGGGAIVIGPYIRDCPGSHQTGEGAEKGKGRPGRCSDQMGIEGSEGAVAASKQGHVEWPCEQGPGGSTKPR